MRGGRSGVGVVHCITDSHCAHSACVFLDRFEYLAALHPPSPQGVLRWCPTIGLLFSAGPKGDVSGWDLDSMSVVVKLGSGTLPQRGRDGTMKSGAHKDVVMDIVEISDHNLIITAGMDARVAMWTFGKGLEEHQLRFAGELGTFTHGVRQLTYITDADVLVTVGFGHDAIAWDVGSRLVLATIAGHRHTLVGAVATAGRPQHLVTADVAGNFKVWLLQKNSMHHAPPLIQAFDASNDIATYVPSTFVATGVHHSIVCGARRLLVFESVRKIDLDDAPAVGLFCSQVCVWLWLCGCVFVAVAVWLWLCGCGCGCVCVCVCGCVCGCVCVAVCVCVCLCTAVWRVLAKSWQSLTVCDDGVHNTESYFPHCKWCGADHLVGFPRKADGQVLQSGEPPHHSHDR